jgi:hypothetical protein
MGKEQNGLPSLFLLEAKGFKWHVLFVSSVKQCMKQKDEGQENKEQPQQDGSSGRADQMENAAHHTHTPGNDEEDRFDMNSLKGVVDRNTPKKQEDEGQNS